MRKGIQGDIGRSLSIGLRILWLITLVRIVLAADSRARVQLELFGILFWDRTGRNLIRASTKKSSKSSFLGFRFLLLRLLALLELQVNRRMLGCSTGQNEEREDTYLDGMVSYCKSRSIHSSAISRV